MELLTPPHPAGVAAVAKGHDSAAAVEGTMARNFRIRVCRREGWLTLELVGEIDGSSGAEISYLVETLGPRECTLDFSRVEAIDVFGARVLAKGIRSLRTRGVQFEVEGLPERVAETLCLGGVLEAIV